MKATSCGVIRSPVRVRILREPSWKSRCSRMPGRAFSCVCVYPQYAGPLAGETENPPRQHDLAPHIYVVLSIAIKASGALNRPAQSAGGMTAARA